LKPVLLLTGHAPRDRHGAFEALHARVPIELGLFGGRHQHGAAAIDPPAGVPHRRIAEREVAELISSGDYRAVIAGSGGRVALPLAWRSARRQELPFIFWSALWHTPRTAAHLAAVPLLRRIHREAAAVVTYGSHVSSYATACGARHTFIAPQAVENGFWSVGARARDQSGPLNVLFVGRDERAKGLHVLLDAWRRAAFAGSASLTIAGDAAPRSRVPPGVRMLGYLSPPELRNFYAASDVLVIPSVRTRGFLEPWGLVVNEAMNQMNAIVASDAVGAAAGGLVRHERNGLIVPAGEPRALADALTALATDRARCAELGAHGPGDVAGYTYQAWAEGFMQALAVAVSPAPPASVTR
jgi:glycosyltransferase involved in cell wall biosynthesis